MTEEQKKPELHQHIHRMPKGKCKFCDEHGNDPMMPDHTPSTNCKSGGKEHCTCSACF